MNWSGRKKKWVVLISIFLLVLAGVVWFKSGSEPPIEIKGDLSAQDVAEIKRVVRRELRRRIFPGLSLKNLKELPANVKNYSRLRIRSIQLFTNAAPQRIVSIGGGFFEGSGVTSGASVVVSEDVTPISTLRSQCFVVTNGAAGWGITNVPIIRFFD